MAPVWVRDFLPLEEMFGRKSSSDLCPNIREDWVASIKRPASVKLAGWRNKGGTFYPGRQLYRASLRPEGGPVYPGGTRRSLPSESANPVRYYGNRYDPIFNLATTKKLGAQPGKNHKLVKKGCGPSLLFPLISLLYPQDPWTFPSYP